VVGGLYQSFALILYEGAIVGQSDGHVALSNGKVGIDV